MARSIHKWSLPVTEVTTIDMPIGAKIIHVESQWSPETVEIWAEVDVSQPMKPRTFLVYGTGHRIDREGDTYVGTAVVAGGSLVWHLYEATHG